MTGFEIVSLLLLLGVPVAGSIRVAWPGRRSASAWFLEALLLALYLVAIALAFPWLVLPRSALVVLGPLALLALAVGATILARRTPARVRPLHRFGLLLRLGLVALLGWVTVSAFRGREPLPIAAVELAFPLGEGSYLVANGGSTEVVNAHLATLDRERARPYRGQSYAVDVVGAGRWGSRGSGLSPRGLEGFAIFGTAILSPCSGRVVQATDGDPDRRPPGEAPRTLEGNHVILECDDAWIVLAHMQRGSVRAPVGSLVEVGQLLGRVGNSGNSDEPHLHIHAQTAGSREAMLSGDPLPITFGGRHLVRNARIRVGEGEEESGV